MFSSNSSAGFGHQALARNMTPEHLEALQGRIAHLFAQHAPVNPNTFKGALYDNFGTNTFIDRGWMGPWLHELLSRHLTREARDNEILMLPTYSAEMAQVFTNVVEEGLLDEQIEALLIACAEKCREGKVQEIKPLLLGGNLSTFKEGYDSINARYEHLPGAKQKIDAVFEDVLLTFEQNAACFAALEALSSDQEKDFYLTHHAFEQLKAIIDYRVVRGGVENRKSHIAQGFPEWPMIIPTYPFPSAQALENLDQNIQALIAEHPNDSLGTDSNDILQFFAHKCAQGESLAPYLLGGELKKFKEGYEALKAYWSGIPNLIPESLSVTEELFESVNICWEKNTQLLELLAELPSGKPEAYYLESDPFAELKRRTESNALEDSFAVLPESFSMSDKQYKYPNDQSNISKKIGEDLFSSESFIEAFFSISEELVTKSMELLEQLEEEDISEIENVIEEYQAARKNKDVLNASLSLDVIENLLIRKFYPSEVDEWERKKSQSGDLFTVYGINFVDMMSSLLPPDTPSNGLAAINSELIEAVNSEASGRTACDRKKISYAQTVSNEVIGVAGAVERFLEKSIQKKWKKEIEKDLRSIVEDMKGCDETLLGDIKTTLLSPTGLLPLKEAIDEAIACLPDEKAVALRDFFEGVLLTYEKNLSAYERYEKMVQEKKRDEAVFNEVELAYRERLTAFFTADGRDVIALCQNYPLPEQELAQDFYASLDSAIEEEPIKQKVKACFEILQTLHEKRSENAEKMHLKLKKYYPKDIYMESAFKQLQLFRSFFRSFKEDIIQALSENKTILLPIMPYGHGHFTMAAIRKGPPRSREGFPDCETVLFFYQNSQQAQMQEALKEDGSPAGMTPAQRIFEAFSVEVLASMNCGAYFCDNPAIIPQQTGDASDCFFYASLNAVALHNGLKRLSERAGLWDDIEEIRKPLFKQLFSPVRALGSSQAIRRAVRQIFRQWVQDSQEASNPPLEIGLFDDGVNAVPALSASERVEIDKLRRSDSSTAEHQLPLVLHEAVKLLAYGMQNQVAAWTPDKTTESLIQESRQLEAQQAQSPQRFQSFNPMSAFRPMNGSPLISPKPNKRQGKGNRRPSPLSQCAMKK